MPRKQKRTCLLFILGVVLCAPNGTLANEWTRFRGPNGSGLAEGSGIPTRWTSDDYLWRVELPGSGHSCPVIWDERLFVTAGNEQTGRRTLVCLNRADGQAVWSRDHEGPTSDKHQLNSYASATPAVDAKHVYICWGMPESLLVQAFDHAGTHIWERDLGRFNAGYGNGASPIVYENLLIVPNEQEGDSFIAALDCATGEIRWQTPRPSEVVYSTPCLRDRADGSRELVLISYQQGFTSLDPRTGDTNWQVDVFDKGHVEAAIGSPVIAGDLVLGMCGWMGVKQELIAIRPPDGKSAPQRAWHIDRSAPLCTTPLVKGDLMFLWNDQGIVTCADVRTGRVHWRKRIGGTWYGSPICIDDRLLAMSSEGDAVVLSAKARYQLLTRNSLGEGSHSTPSVADGRLYLRTFTHLIAISGDDGK